LEEIRNFREDLDSEINFESELNQDMDECDIDLSDEYTPEERE